MAEVHGLLTQFEFLEARDRAILRGYYGVSFDANPCCLAHLDSSYPDLHLEDVEEGVRGPGCDVCGRAMGDMGESAESPRHVAKKMLVESPRLNGVVFYDGPSLLDGQPIVAVATGISRPSKNVKTGGEDSRGEKRWLVQTWILCRDIAPTEAVQSGKDVSI